MLSIFHVIGEYNARDQSRLACYSYCHVTWCRSTTGIFVSKYLSSRSLVHLVQYDVSYCNVLPLRESFKEHNFLNDAMGYSVNRAISKWFCCDRCIQTAIVTLMTASGDALASIRMDSVSNAERLMPMCMILSFTECIICSRYLVQKKFYVN